GHRGPVLDDLHLQRLQHRLRAHPRGTDQLDASVCHAGPPGRAGDGTDRRGRGHFAVPVPRPRVRGVGPAPVHPSARQLMGWKARKLTRKIVMHLLVLPFLVFAVFPFYHMTLTSLKQDRELYDRNAIPLLITQGPTLEHYTKLIWDTGFLTWIKNSLLV